MHTNTRCKFVVESTQHGAHGSKLTARPVYVGEEGSANKDFWDATTGGLLELDGMKNGSLERFTPGTEFYLYLVPVAPAP